MRDVFILIGFAVASLLVLAIIVKLLRLSWVIFKALLLIVIFACIFFGLMYSTGMLEKFPFVFELAKKLKELLKPIHDFTKTV